MSRAGTDNMNNPPVANFIRKLWKIVETRENQNVISWSDVRQSVCVLPACEGRNECQVV